MPYYHIFIYLFIHWFTHFIAKLPHNGPGMYDFPLQQCPQMQQTACLWPRLWNSRKIDAQWIIQWLTHMCKNGRKYSSSGSRLIWKPQNSILLIYYTSLCDEPLSICQKVGIVSSCIQSFSKCFVLLKVIYQQNIVNLFHLFQMFDCYKDLEAAQHKSRVYTVTGLTSHTQGPLIYGFSMTRGTNLSIAFSLIMNGRGIMTRKFNIEHWFPWHIFYVTRLVPLTGWTVTCVAR